jgi:hypothetical protein
MYGKYAWNAGATAANIIADLIALFGGAAVNTLSAACNQAQSNTAGAASPWVAYDAAYGVVQAPSMVGAGNKQVQLKVTANLLQMASVEGWNASTHAAVNAMAAQNCSLTIVSAGSVNFLATDEFLMLSASDWSVWQCAFEVKRDGPMLSDVAVPAQFQVGQAACYAPRLKNPTSAGFTVSASVGVISAYGTLGTTTLRDLTDSLYIPLVPLVCFSQTGAAPIGEASALMTSGLYGGSGDYMLDGSGNTYLLAKVGSTPLVAMKRA